MTTDAGEADGATQHAARMARKKSVVDRHIAKAQAERGVLVVNTGTGKGKSSAAFGLVSRALGHGLKIAVIQFIKSRTDTGEEGFFRRFPAQVRWHVMGDGFTWETGDDRRDAISAQAAWKLALGYLADPAVDMIVLDEITYAFKYGWLDVNAALVAFAARPPMQHVIVTGRAAPKELVAAADTVSEVRMVKHAFAAGVKAMPGVEF